MTSQANGMTSQKSKEDLEQNPSVVMSEDEERGQFGNAFEYFLANLGMAVGLGNLWRFPYVCYVNGGGTFLIPYLTMLLLVGLPVYFNDLAVGQFAGTSPAKIFGRLAPSFKGLGYGMTVVPILLGSYYTLVMAYALLFVFYGFDSTLPWSNCRNDFNSANCWSKDDQSWCNSLKNDSQPVMTYYDNKCITVESFCHQMNMTAGINGTSCVDAHHNNLQIDAQNFVLTSPTEDFWNAHILGVQVHGSHIDNTWSDWGSINLPLVGALALAWIIILATLVKGAKAYGKLSYVLTLVPYVVMTVLLIYIGTLEGFGEGVKYYLKPDWSKLTNFQVWKAAASQIFFSLSIGCGGPLVFSSYNNFYKNCHFDAISIAACNSLTSIYAGFLVFGMLGYISFKTQVPIEDIVQAGPGLVFVVYPQGLAAMEFCPQFFSFIFFITILLLGVTSVASLFESVLATYCDQFPILRKWRASFLIAACTFTFLLGFPICFDSGMYFFTLMDNHVGNSLLYMGLLELVTVHWLYGSSNFMKNLTEDMEVRIPKFLQTFWKVCWSFIAPVIIIIAIITSWADRTKDSFMDYVFPSAIQGLGWFIEFLPIIVMVSFTVVVIIRKTLAGEDAAFIRFGPMLSPKETWGPRSDRPDKSNLKGNVNLVVTLENGHHLS